MSLRHDFYLVSTELDEREIHNELFWKLIKNETTPSCTVVKHIDVEDAVFDFLWFSFQWIPSINVDFFDERRYTQGIFRHGVTVFYEKSRLALETNCKAWLQLVQFAPAIIRLQNSYIDDMEKQTFISFLEQLLQFSEKLDQPNVYILHYGI